MDFDIARYIVVPLVSPLIAILTLVIYAKQERRKIFVQTGIDLQKLVHATERDIFSLREGYQLIGVKMKRGESIEPERLSVLMEAAERMFKRFNETPALYDQYFSKLNQNIKTDRIPLLLNELHVRFRLLPKATVNDPIILFGLYLLLYARATPSVDSEEVKIIQMLYSTDTKMFGAWWKSDV